jgi:hypothetical protein
LDKQILEIITDLKSEIKEIKGMLNTIERAQTGDIFEVINKRTENELEYLNHRILQMDKRIFFLEKQSIYGR